MSEKKLITAEEVLQKHLRDTPDHIDRYEAIISAMQEYASQFHPSSPLSDSEIKKKAEEVWQKQFKERVVARQVKQKEIAAMVEMYRLGQSSLPLDTVVYVPVERKTKFEFLQIVSLSGMPIRKSSGWLKKTTLRDLINPQK